MSEAKPQSFFRFSIMPPLSSLTQVLILSNAGTGFLRHHFLFLCHLNTVFEPHDFGHWLRLDACCMLSLHSNTACSKKIKNRFFNKGESGTNRRHLKAAAANIARQLSCVCKSPEKVVQSWALHTFRHVFNIRILCFVKVFRDTQNVQCILIQLI